MRTKCNRFWVPSWIVVLTIGVLSALTACGQTHEPATPSSPGSQHTWKVYTNVRFNYSICYPADLLVPQGEPEDADGQKFVAADGGVLLVYGSYPLEGQTLTSTLDDIGQRLMGASGKVTYRVLRASWGVVSGSDAQTLFYSKTLVRGGVFKTFELTYPAAQKTIYDPIASRLNSCFANTTP